MTTSSYDQIATWYDESVRNGSLIHDLVMPGIFTLLGAYHRTLSTYVNTLVEAGLALERILEPQATGAIAERVPGYKEVPAMLLIRCRKI